jgi:hypothetical protein
MTQERLDAIKARCEAATRGPWTLTGSKHQLVDSDDKAPMYKSIVCEVWHDTPNNAAFIVHARQDIPDLLQEVERLQAANNRLLERLEQLQMENSPRSWKGEEHKCLTCGNHRKGIWCAVCHYVPIGRKELT